MFICRCQSVFISHRFVLLASFLPSRGYCQAAQVLTWDGTTAPLFAEGKFPIQVLNVSLRLIGGARLLHIPCPNQQLFLFLPINSQPVVARVTRVRKALLPESGRSLELAVLKVVRCTLSTKIIRSTLFMSNTPHIVCIIPAPPLQWHHPSGRRFHFFTKSHS